MYKILTYYLSDNYTIITNLPTFRLVYPITKSGKELFAHILNLSLEE